MENDDQYSNEYKFILEALDSNPKTWKYLDRGFKVDEIGAVYWYSLESSSKSATSGSQVLNSFLRSHDISTLSPKQKEKYLFQLKIRDNLIEFLKKAPSLKKARVYRGIQVNSRRAVRDFLVVGKVVSDPAFVSATTDVEIAKGFANKSTGKIHIVFEIQTKSAKSIAQFSEFSGEDEVLIPPNTKFKVVEVANSKAYIGTAEEWTVKLQEISE